MTQLRIALFLVAVIAVCLVIVINRRPTCLAVMMRVPPGTWSQSDRSGPVRVPAWGHDAQEIRCRDGVVTTWRGDAPENTTANMVTFSGGELHPVEPAK